MKVSIITPIYNAEDHIEKSVESVLNQSYKDIELILINDGSTDNSETICREYEKKDKRVTLLNIKNSGAGYARNKGLEIAKGEYISFVDADDYLHHDAIDTLLKKALVNGYDVVTGGYFIVRNGVVTSKNNYDSREINKFGTKEGMKHYNSFKTSSSFGYVWGKVYKKSFLKIYDIRFSEERKVFLEDTLLNLKVFANNPRYYVLSKPIYYYNIVEGSLSSKSQDVTDLAIKVIEDYEDFLDKENLYYENFDIFITLASRIIAYSLYKTMVHNSSFKNIYNKVKIFSNNKTIRRLFSSKDSFKKIRQLNSKLQILLYSFIIMSIKYKLEIILSLVFYIFNPLFNVYIKKYLKR